MSDDLFKLFKRFKIFKLVEHMSREIHGPGFNSAEASSVRKYFLRGYVTW